MYAGAGKMFGIVPIDRDRIYMLAGFPDPEKPRYAPEDFVDLVKTNFSEFEGLALEELVVAGNGAGPAAEALATVNGPVTFDPGAGATRLSARIRTPRGSVAIP